MKCAVRDPIDAYFNLILSPINAEFPPLPVHYRELGRLPRLLKALRWSEQHYFPIEKYESTIIVVYVYLQIYDAIFDTATSVAKNYV